MGMVHTLIIARKIMTLIVPVGGTVSRNTQANELTQTVM